MCVPGSSCQIGGAAALRMGQENVMGRRCRQCGRQRVLRAGFDLRFVYVALFISERDFRIQGAIIEVSGGPRIQGSGFGSGSLGPIPFGVCFAFWALLAQPGYRVFTGF